MKQKEKSRFLLGETILYALLLMVLILAVYFPLSGHGFVVYGDPLWITENEQVQSGPDVDGILWAFSSFETGNWSPLSWISVMIDVKLHGLEAGGHHVTGILLHAGAVLLLFLSLRGLTGAAGRSFAVAALYAVHPLNVEAVAWAAARRDLLGAFFWMLTLAAYLLYVRAPGPSRYLMVTCAFAAGLLSSAQLAALPLVLLLLDLWPLKRLPGGPEEGAVTEGAYPAMPVREVIEEKVPLAAMAFTAAVVNFFARQGGDAAGYPGEVSFLSRTAEALASGFWYPLKTLWPAKLAVVYSRPGGTSLFMTAALAALLLGAVTVLAVRLRRKAPAVTLGWCWYLAALAPVLLAPGGESFFADRHAGLPLAGVLTAGVWGVSALAAGRIPAPALWGAAVVLTMALAVGAGRQARYWSDSDTLFDRALEVSGKSPFVHRVYGRSLVSAGEGEEGVAQYREALSSDPGDLKIRRELAAVLVKMGREAEAIEEYRVIRQANPGDPRITFLLGSELARERRYDEAEPVLREALEQRPGHARTVRNLATTLLRLEKHGEAAALYRRALEIEPGHPTAERNLGEALVELGEFGEAAGLLREALRNDPGRARTHYYLGRAFQGTGETERAEKRYRAAIRLQPAYPEARESLGTIHYGRKQYDEALEQYREAARSMPESAELKRRQGDTLLRLGRLEEAEGQYRAALELDSSDPMVHNNLGTVLFKRGFADEAVASYRKALEIDPGFAMAYFNLGNVIFKAGRPGEAVPFYDRALELRPNYEKAREYRQRALKATGGKGEAKGR